LPVFSKSVVIDAPVARVFAFHQRDDALRLLSPPFPRVQISRTGALEIGARVVLRCGPFRWVARHTDFVQDRLFVDEQVEGPFQLWVHRHEFEDLCGKTRLTDRVEYCVRGGSLWNVVVRPLLWCLFAYRHRVTMGQTSGPAG
jgi:ligand-binding SRPBCC domain-containing protein